MAFFSRKAAVSVTKGSIEMPSDIGKPHSRASKEFGTSLPLNEAANRITLTHLMSCIKFSDKWTGPEAWLGYRPKFMVEESLRQEFQTLRLQRVRERVETVGEAEAKFSRAKRQLLQNRALLEACDEEQIKNQAEFDQNYLLLAKHPNELKRFQANSTKIWINVFLIAAVLISSEVALTQNMFTQALGLTNQGYGYVLSASVLGLLWVVPHFGARALKDSIYSSGRAASEENEGQASILALDKKIRTSENVLKWLTVSALFLLIILIAPLTATRFKALLGSNTFGAPKAPGIYSFWWLSFICVIQLLIALVFFWLEWNFYGLLSTNTLAARKKLDESAVKRKSALEKYREGELLFVAKSLQLWQAYLQSDKDDQLIRTHYLNAISRGRSAMAEQMPQFEVFINLAEKPILEDMPLPAEAQRQVLGTADEAERFAREEMMGFMSSNGFSPYADPFISEKNERNVTRQRELKKKIERGRETNENAR